MRDQQRKLGFDLYGSLGLIFAVEWSTRERFKGKA